MVIFSKVTETTKIRTVQDCAAISAITEFLYTLFFLVQITVRRKLPIRRDTDRLGTHVFVATWLVVGTTVGGAGPAMQIARLYIKIREIGSVHVSRISAS